MQAASYITTHRMTLRGELYVIRGELLHCLNCIKTMHPMAPKSLYGGSDDDGDEREEVKEECEVSGRECVDERGRYNCD